jgi:hypothetical protein
VSVLIAQPTPHAFVDKKTITIGEILTYTLEIDLHKDSYIDFTKTGLDMGGFELKGIEDEQDEKIEGSKIRKRRHYRLTTYTVGSYIIPEQMIRITQPDQTVNDIQTQAIFIDVKSTLDESENSEDIKDIKGPVAMPFTLNIYYIMGSLIILIIGGFIAFHILKRRGLKQVPIIIKSADEIALIELDRIEALDLIKNNKMKAYYYLVSNCLRVYLENRYQIKAPEQTTEEFIDDVTQSDILDEAHINLLKEYLTHCDLVKYAKLAPPISESQKIMTTTRNFIDKTRPISELETP